MKAQIERFINWRRARIQARAVKSTMHVFTKRERWFAKLLGKVLNVFYPLTLYNGLFCYEGNCSNCASYVNRFFIPILGRITGKSLPTDREWYLTRNTLVCPHCGAPLLTIGIFKTYDVMEEFKKMQEAHHEQQ